MLWSFKPNLNKVDTLGRSALHHAARNGNETALEFILSPPEEENGND
jgi:ankyrin repeat protein